MYKITLISTNHSESGKCNSYELYKIIEALSPEVIFEELPISLHKLIYNDPFFNLPKGSPIELKCVKDYLKKYRVKNIPVDAEGKPRQSRNEIFMLKTFEEDEDHMKFQKEYNSLKFQEGFDFFNSDKYLDFSERNRLIEKRILESLPNMNFLHTTYRAFQAEIHNRENTMLQNIYNYSKENQFSQAVFLLGCGHRKAMLEKIPEYTELAEIKLNWNIYYGNKTCISL